MSAVHVRGFWWRSLLINVTFIGIGRALLICLSSDSDAVRSGFHKSIVHGSVFEGVAERVLNCYGVTTGETSWYHPVSSRYSGAQV